MKSKRKHDNRQLEVATFCRAIKAMARELSIPIVVLVQLSRQVETRGKNKRPQLSDLRESGAIEQDADVVIFVYREEVYLEHLPPTDKKRIDAKGKAEIMVAKQRQGPTGLAKLAFVKEFVRFENLAYSHQEEEPEDQEEMPF
jgi:replicative DNA helicase